MRALRVARLATGSVFSARAADARFRLPRKSELGPSARARGLGDRGGLLGRGVLVAGAAYRCFHHGALTGCAVASVPLARQSRRLDEQLRLGVADARAGLPRYLPLPAPDGVAN
jgi:hypothetical protein